VGDNSNKELSLIIAIILATAIHLLVVSGMILLGISPITIKEKTIPFVLVSADNKANASKSKPLTKSENSLAAQEYLATLNSSTFLTQKNTKYEKKHVRPTQEQQKPNKTPMPPSFSEPAKHSENRFLQGLRNIFSSTMNQKAAANNKQISTQSTEELSQYEILLLNQLVKDILYDQFHAVMKSNKKDSINYILTLTLLANGAIKNANIKVSSGISKIDHLAKQAAYRASPFPTPPKEDFKRGFKYDIPIIYQPTKK